MYNFCEYQLGYTEARQGVVSGNGACDTPVGSEELARVALHAWHRGAHILHSSLLGLTTPQTTPVPYTLLPDMQTLLSS